MAERVWTPQQVIDRIAEIAEVIAWQANIGASELAGHFVSVMAKHPELIERLLERGRETFLDDFEEWGAERGRLTFLNAAGKVTTPKTLAIARQVQKLKRTATPSPGGA